MISRVVEADPGAVPFYLRMGCRVIGSVASGSIPGRILPLLAMDIREDIPASEA